MTDRTAQWHKLLGALGAQCDVEANSLTGPQLRQALNEHRLLVFRDQSLNPASFTQFAARLGELDRYPFAQPLPESEHVVAVVKESGDQENFGGAWHTDTAYAKRPPSITLLYAVEVPDAAGDTLFADMQSAYEGLSAGFQETLNRLRGFNTAALVHDVQGAHAGVVGQSVTLKQADEPTDAEHPLVCVHPDTGQRTLYFSLIHTANFVGMTRQESLPLLNQLHTLVTRPENCTRLRWQPGTLAIWDNRCLQHYPLNDYAGQRREMHRIILKGDVPMGVTQQ